MATIAANMQAQGDELIGLSNALALAARNHRWSEVGAILPQIIRATYKTMGYLESLDPELAHLSHKEGLAAIEAIKKQFMMDEAPSGADAKGGQVSDKPTA